MQEENTCLIAIRLNQIAFWTFSLSGRMYRVMRPPADTSSWKTDPHDRAGRTAGREGRFETALPNNKQEQTEVRSDEMEACPRRSTDRRGRHRRRDPARAAAAARAVHRPRC